MQLPCRKYGHSTKNCTALKYKVQKLIKIGKVIFEDTDSPNVTVNHLPNHLGPKINAIYEEERFVVQRDARKSMTLMVDVFKALTLAKIIPVKKEKE